MDNYTYADARGTEQLTAAGLEKVLLDTAAGHDRKYLGSAVGVSRDRVIRMIKTAETKDPAFRSAWWRALAKGREKRRLDRVAAVAQGLPKAEKWVPVPHKPDDLFAQAMAGRRFDDFAIPQGRVVSGRTHAWVLGAGS